MAELYGGPSSLNLTNTKVVVGTGSTAIISSNDITFNVPVYMNSASIGGSTMTVNDKSHILKDGSFMYEWDRGLPAEARTTYSSASSVPPNMGIDAAGAFLITASKSVTIGVTEIGAQLIKCPGLVCSNSLTLRSPNGSKSAVVTHSGGQFVASIAGGPQVPIFVRPALPTWPNAASTVFFKRNVPLSAPESLAGTYPAFIASQSDGFALTHTCTSAVPTGLAYSGAGVLTGTPSDVAGQYPLTFKAAVLVREIETSSLSQTFSFYMVDVPAWQTGSTLNSTLVNTAYSLSLSASPAARTKFIKQSGLAWAVVSEAGAVSGTPSATGTYTFVVRAESTPTPLIYTDRTFTIVVASKPAWVTPPNVGTVVQNGVDYNISLSAPADGGVVSYSTSNGNVAISGSTAAVKVNSFATGTQTFVIAANNTTSTGEVYTTSQTFTVNVASAPVWSTAADFGTVAVGMSLPSISVTATSQTTVSYSTTSSNGVSSNASGAFSGTPSAAGTFTYSITPSVSGLNGSLSGSARSFSMTVVPTPVWVTASPLLAYTQTFSMSVTFSATNASSYAHTSGTLPPGTSFSGNTLSGTPSADGSYAFTLTASSNPTSYNQILTSSKEFSTVIEAYPPPVTSNGGMAVMPSTALELTTSGTTFTFEVCVNKAYDYFNDSNSVSLSRVSVDAYANSNSSRQLWPYTPNLYYGTRQSLELIAKITPNGGSAQYYTVTELASAGYQAQLKSIAGTYTSSTGVVITQNAIWSNVSDPWRLSYFSTAGIGYAWKVLKTDGTDYAIYNHTFNNIDDMTGFKVNETVGNPALDVGTTSLNVYAIWGSGLTYNEGRRQNTVYTIQYTCGSDIVTYTGTYTPGITIPVSKGAGTATLECYAQFDTFVMTDPMKETTGVAQPVVKPYTYSKSETKTISWNGYVPPAPPAPPTSTTNLGFRHPNGKLLRRDGDKIRLNTGTEVTITLTRPSGLYGIDIGFMALYDGSAYLRHAGYVMWSAGLNTGGPTFDWAWRIIQVSPGNYNLYNDYKDKGNSDAYYLGYDSADDRLRIVKMTDSRMVTWSIQPNPPADYLS